MLPSENKPLYFVQLDALRFLAAMMIVVMHSYESWVSIFHIPSVLSTGDMKTYSSFGNHVHLFLSNFTVGVDFFFLISGFLITYLLLREKKETGKINIGKFYVRRILRIWPLYFLIIALGPLLVNWITKPGEPLPDYKSAIFFYNNFFTMHTQPLQWIFPFSHFWSVCIEEHFYLVWPLLVAFIPVKRIPQVLGGIILFSIAFRGWAIHTPGYGWAAVYLHTFARIDVLALGGLAAYFVFHRPYSFGMKGWMRAGLLLFLLAAFFFTDSNSLDSVWEACVKKFLYLIPAGILMLDYVFNEKAPLRFGPKNVISYFGKTSYGIYMYGNILHIIIVQKIVCYYQYSWYFALLVIASSLLVPALSYELIEKPFLKLKSKFAVIRTRI